VLLDQEALVFVCFRELCIEVADRGLKLPYTYLQLLNLCVFLDAVCAICVLLTVSIFIDFVL
jgi:hypothetical protein